MTGLKEKEVVVDSKAARQGAEPRLTVLEKIYRKLVLAALGAMSAGRLELTLPEGQRLIFGRRDGEDAPDRHVLGRSLRPGRRSVGPHLVDRDAREGHDAGRDRAGRHGDVRERELRLGQDEVLIEPAKSTRRAEPRVPRASSHSVGARRPIVTCPWTRPSRRRP